ncbi:MAG TPA: hypothetical protein VIC03_13090, partial [Gemmatimonadaceae bacterium]
EYPRSGAMIDYYFAHAPEGAVTLEILDAKGNVVRSFASAATPNRAADATIEPVQEEDAPRRRPAATTLTSHQGLNRFIWDLTYPGPRQSATRPAGGGGPEAVPGAYRVRLTVAASGTTQAWSTTQALVLKPDPRVTRDGVTIADMREQFDHNMRVRDLVTDVNVAVSRIRAAQARLKGGTGAAADTLQKLAAIAAKLETPPIRYSEPQLQGNITYLYGMTNGADQKIGRDAIQRYRTLRAELDVQLAALNRLLGADAGKFGK